MDIPYLIYIIDDFHVETCPHSPPALEDRPGRLASLYVVLQVERKWLYAMPDSLGETPGFTLDVPNISCMQKITEIGYKNHWK